MEQLAHTRVVKGSWAAGASGSAASVTAAVAEPAAVGGCSRVLFAELREEERAADVDGVAAEAVAFVADSERASEVAGTAAAQGAAAAAGEETASAEGARSSTALRGAVDGVQKLVQEAAAAEDTAVDFPVGNTCWSSLRSSWSECPFAGLEEEWT